MSGALVHTDMQEAAAASAVLGDCLQSVPFISGGDRGASGAPCMCPVLHPTRDQADHRFLK